MPNEKNSQEQLKYLSPQKVQEIYEKFNLFQKDYNPYFSYELPFQVNAPFEQLSFLYYDGGRIDYKSTS